MTVEESLPAFWTDFTSLEQFRQASIPSISLCITRGWMLEILIRIG
jgi:hypothetical protein